MIQPTVIITTRPLDGSAFEHVTDLETVASAPYSLNGVVVAAEVATPEVASSVLAVVLRGASAVLWVHLHSAEREVFLDQLRRIAEVSEQHEPILEPAQQELLELLRSGLSLGAAAARIGVSRRTADRRLAAARAALGVRTTMEAVMLLRRSP